MKTQDMHLLIDVARRSSFADVARARGLDPSAVSRSISSIEEKLGFRLFHRTTRGMALTEAGEMYVRQIEGIVDQLDQARDDAAAVNTGPAGNLRMTMTVAFGQRVIVPLVPKFRAAYPQVSLDLILSDANLDLAAERIDLAIRLGARMHGDMVVTRLMSTNYRVCASPDYLMRHSSPRRPEELSGHDCLLLGIPGFRSRWRFRDDAGQVSEVPVTGALVASGALAVHSLALSGLGPALLANWLVVDDIAEGRLIDLFPNHRVTGTTFDTAVWLLYPSRSFLPRKVRVMIDFLRGEVRPMLRRRKEASALAAATA